MKKYLLLLALALSSLASTAQVKPENLNAAGAFQSGDLIIINQYRSGAWGTRKGTVSQLDTYLSPFFTAKQNKYLTGYVLGANTPVTSTDSVIQAIGKLQRQTNARVIFPDTVGQNGKVLGKTSSGFAWVTGGGGGGSYTNGTGLSLGSNVFSLNLGYTDARYTGFGSNTLQNGAIWTFPAAFNLYQTQMRAEGFYTDFGGYNMRVGTNVSDWIGLIYSKAGYSVKEGYPSSTTPSGNLTLSNPTDETGTKTKATREYIYDPKATIITANYTVQASDLGKTLRCMNTSAIIVTIPAGLGSAFSFNIVRDTTGLVTLAGSGGVNLQTSGNTLIIQNENSWASVFAVSPNNFRVSGDFQSGGGGGVTSFGFTNGGGFTGTVTNSTTTPTLALTQQNATTSQSGQLTSTDWNTFNNKATFNYQVHNDALLYQVKHDHMDLITNWNTTTTGTGAGVQSDMHSTSYSDVIRLGTGSTSTGKAAIKINTNFGPLNIALGGKAQTYGFTFITGALSDATDSYILRVGLADDYSDSPARGAFIEYTHSQNSGRFRIGVGTGGSITYTNTTITVAANTQYTFQFYYDLTNINVLYNNTGNIATISSGIPTGLSNRLTPIFYMLKVNGTNPVFLYGDIYSRYYAQ